MTPAVPPATGIISPPTATDPPTPTPTTIHPTWALAVWPLLTVNVLEALIEVLEESRVVVEVVVVVAAGGDELGAFVDVGNDPRENDGFGFWLLPVVELTDVFGLALGAGRSVGTFSLLLCTVVLLGGIFWLFVLRLWLL